VEVIHIAAQIKIQTERNTGQDHEGFLPFVDGYLNKVAFIFRFVNSDDALIGVRNDFFCHKDISSISYFLSERTRCRLSPAATANDGIFTLCLFCTYIITRILE